MTDAPARSAIVVIPNCFAPIRDRRKRLRTQTARGQHPVDWQWFATASL